MKIWQQSTLNLNVEVFADRRDVDVLSHEQNVRIDNAINAFVALLDKELTNPEIKITPK